VTLFRWDTSSELPLVSYRDDPQSNNDTTGLRLIDNMVLPHIWLAQENITKIQWGNIT
jgi:hypothetical protein